MKKNLFKNLCIGIALLPLALQAQEGNAIDANLMEKLKRDAAVEARITATYYSKKFDVSIDTGHVLYKVIYNKQLKMNLAFAQYSGLPQQDEQIARIIALYDKKMETYLRPLAAEDFLNKKLVIIDSVKPLAITEKQKLRNLFLNKTKTSENSYKEILLEAMNTITNDTAYYAAIFNVDIHRKALEMASDYAIDNKLPNKALVLAKKYVYQEKRELVLVDYSMPKANEEKRKLVNNINDHYKPVIDSILMMEGIKLPNTRLTGLALANSKALKLSQQQTVALTSVCIAIIKEKETFKSKNMDGKYDSRFYEYEQLPKILTEQQYDNLLTLKFKDQALSDTDLKWQQIHKEGIDKNVNTNQQKKQVFTYYLNRLVAKEKFATNKDLQIAQVKSIDSVKPQILKKLETVQKTASRKEELKSALTW